MMSSIFVDTIEMRTIHCSRCGIPFATTNSFYLRKRDDHKTFFCPSGHKNYYPQESIEELESELSEKKCCTKVHDEIYHLERKLDGK